MSDPRGFLRIQREKAPYRPIAMRRQDWDYIGESPTNDLRAKQQATRCMDCGVPFCQSSYGCPVQNVIPEWNDLVSSEQWRPALQRLHATNNFPEFTGFLCPAPCESACVLNRANAPVAIRDIELQIIEKGFAEGWVLPQPPAHLQRERVAIVGSGPAGLAAAQQLRRLGFGVTVFERGTRPGGLLRYGIPDFKMGKQMIDRRLDQLLAEGVVFKTGISVGADLSLVELRRDYDAVLIAVGAEAARNLPLPGMELDGVHLAMDFLVEQNKAFSGEGPPARISAKDKRVAIIGGGDTSSDCIGTAIRQGATTVYELIWNELPPTERSKTTPWPLWPLMLKTSHAHEEGVARHWAVTATRITGSQGRVAQLHVVPVVQAGAPPDAAASDGFALEVDMVLLAIGFTGVSQGFAAATPELELRPGGTVATAPDFATSLPGVFAAGDAKRGASLIVWAIAEGRQAAAAIARYLQARRQVPQGLTT